MNSVENISIENDTLKLEGYAFYLNQDSTNASISLFLKNLKNNDEIWMETETINRPDIREHYNCKFNYANYGFIATKKYNKLSMEDGYEIFINIDTFDESGNKYRKTVSSKRYLFEDRILSFNPYDFDYPDANIKSDLLKNVLTKGLLHIYRKDIGLYVYEYQNKLYWIANNHFPFDEDGKTYIPYQLYTTQNSNLPEYRIQYGFDNLDFYFEDNELTNEATYPYRVAVHDIPVQYTVTYIVTGIYDTANKDWLCREFFQIKY